MLLDQSLGSEVAHAEQRLIWNDARLAALTCRINFCDTPKHGNWLNIDENELRSITRQCLNDRWIGELVTLLDEIDAWSRDVNCRKRVLRLHADLQSELHRIEYVDRFDHFQLTGLRDFLTS